MKPKLDTSNPACNMYGVLPCPECKSEYRWPTRADAKTEPPSTIICDDCGFKEPYEPFGDPHE